MPFNNVNTAHNSGHLFATHSSYLDYKSDQENTATTTINNGPVTKATSGLGVTIIDHNNNNA
jgi:hypothetical protein